MDNYEITKEPTLEQKEFLKKAQEINNKIAEILKDSKMELIPELSITKQGIVPVISLNEIKENNLVFPETPILIPK
jgi:hypothetical protein